MLNLGTLNDANTIARSPFLQPEEVRLNTAPPSLSDCWSAWRLCKKRSTHANIATFSDYRPGECADVLVTHLRASLFQHPDSMRRVLKERRCEYDPTVLPWKPKDRYLELLAYEQRLPPQGSK